MAKRLRNPDTRLIYKFIQDHGKEYPVEMMCRVLEVAPSGYYEVRVWAWPMDAGSRE